jgi:hypothetical protein
METVKVQLLEVKKVKKAKPKAPKAPSRECAHCGKPFTPSKFVHNQQFCSTECRKAGYPEDRKPTAGPRTCPIDGTVWTPRAGHEWEATCPVCSAAHKKAKAHPKPTAKQAGDTY